MAKRAHFHATHDTAGPAWKTLARGSLDARALEATVKAHVKGRFARSSIKRAAAGLIEVLEEGGDFEGGEVLFHDGDLQLPGDFVASDQPLVSMLVVDGDLVLAGDFDTSSDPNAIVVVTGDLRARNVLNGAFLEVQGDLVASTAVVFSDNDPCSEIMGDLVAPLLYTRYHAARVHGSLVSKLYTGDDDTVESKTQKKKERGFLEETDVRVRDRLSPALLKVLADEMFDVDDADAEDGWIDYIDEEKVRAFLRKGGSPLKNT